MPTGNLRPRRPCAELVCWAVTLLLHLAVDVHAGGVASGRDDDGCVAAQATVAVVGRASADHGVEAGPRTAVNEPLSDEVTETLPSLP